MRGSEPHHHTKPHQGVAKLMRGSDHSGSLSFFFKKNLFPFFYIYIKVWLRGAAIIQALFLHLQSHHELGGRMLIAGSGSGALGSKILKRRYTVESKY
jgi:hypothetical protein